MIMSQSVIDSLGEVTNAITGNQTAEQKIASLTKAFELFSQETLRLEEAYQNLKKQFQSVNLQLEDTNHELQKKVQELDLTSHYLNSILNNMTQGILCIDHSGLVTTYNHAAAKILDISTEEVLFQPFSHHFADDFFQFSVQESLTSGKAPHSTYSTIKKEGKTPLELEVSTSFVKTQDSTYQGLIILFRDITELRQLQMISRRQDRLQELGEMAAAVAHEIRNPLGGIKGFASLLCRDLEESPSQQQLAAQIVDGSETLERLVSNVLNYSRPVQMQVELSNLQELLDSVIALVQADSTLTQEKEITFNTLTPNQQLTAPIDRQLFQSALLNLLVNSIQAIESQGTITLPLYERK